MIIIFSLKRTILNKWFWYKITIYSLILLYKYNITDTEFLWHVLLRIYHIWHSTSVIFVILKIVFEIFKFYFHYFVQWVSWISNVTKILYFHVKVFYLTIQLHKNYILYCQLIMVKRTNETNIVYNQHLFLWIKCTYLYKEH